MSEVELNKLVKELVNCTLCPRLVKYRESVKPKAAYRGEEYWKRPVPPWSSVDARIMLVGLAPAAHGGNRTGRVFTGDPSAQFLFKALYSVGLADKPYSISRDDGVRIRCLHITSVVKCAPPDNKPTMTELNTCINNWLRYELSIIKPRVIVVLGNIAWLGISKVLGIKDRFRHGEYVDAGNVRIFMSYHPSPRNTNTRRLKLEDLVNILNKAKEYAGC